MILIANGVDISSLFQTVNIRRESTRRFGGGFESNSKSNFNADGMCQFEIEKFADIRRTLIETFSTDEAFVGYSATGKQNFFRIFKAEITEASAIERLEIMIYTLLKMQTDKIINGVTLTANPKEADKQIRQLLTN
ncbi:MAG: hypothetical protein ACR2MD_01035 [Aridibacter sp.]